MKNLVCKLVVLLLVVVLVFVVVNINFVENGLFEVEVVSG